MKKLLLVLMIAISISVKGQREEDCRTKICYSGYKYGTTYIVLIFNKTNVWTCYNVVWPDGSTGTSDLISPNGSGHVQLTKPFQAGNVSVKPVENANAPCPYQAVNMFVQFPFTNKRCY